MICLSGCLYAAALSIYQHHILVDFPHPYRLSMRSRLIYNISITPSLLTLPVLTYYRPQRLATQILALIGNGQFIKGYQQLDEALTVGATVVGVGA